MPGLGGWGSQKHKNDCTTPTGSAIVLVQRLLIVFTAVGLSSFPDISLQCFHVGREGIGAFRRDAADGAGLFPLESLLHFDVSGLFEFVDLYAQVTGRGPGLFLDVGKFGLVDTDEQ